MKKKHALIMAFLLISTLHLTFCDDTEETRFTTVRITCIGDTFTGNYSVNKLGPYPIAPDTIVAGPPERSFRTLYFEDIDIYQIYVDASTVGTTALSISISIYFDGVLVASDTTTGNGTTALTATAIYPELETISANYYVPYNCVN